MKNTKYILPVFAALALAACDDDYYEKNFDDIEPTIASASTTAYTLTAADYKTIASSSVNQALAAAAGDEALAALEEVSSKAYFNNLISAEDYVPAFLAANSTFVMLENNSMINVTYNVENSTPSYMADFTNLVSYELSSSDYSAAWANRGVSASYLTPKTIGRIPSLLATEFADAAEGKMVAVDYIYSDLEPAVGSASADQKYIFAANINGSYIPWGYLEQESYTYGYFKADPVTVTDGVITAEDAKKYLITASANGEGYNLMNSLDKYIYMTGTYDSYNVTNDIPSEGGIWTITPASDGTFDIMNVEKSKYVKYDTKYNSFGAYAESKFAPVYYNTLLGDEGNFTIVNVNDGGATSPIWTNSSSYGWVASAYIGGSRYATDTYIVSPQIDLSSTSSPVLSCDIAVNFIGTYTPTQLVKIKVSTDYAGDVTTATWTELNDKVANWSEGKSYDFVNTGNVDLSDFKGQKIYLAFEYISDGTENGTPKVEFKNLRIGEAYFNVNIFAVNDEGNYELVTSLDEATAANKAAKSANTTALYSFNGSEWEEYSNSNATVVALQPAVYNSLDESYISNPSHVLPLFLNNNYVYAEDGDEAVIVYSASSTTVEAEAFVRENGAWIARPEFITETLSFAKTVPNDDNNNTGYSAKLDVYINESFLGDEGGFTAYDVTLTGELSYVWSVTSSYGWKASAFKNDTKYESESYLVSPVMNFKNATAPYLNADLCCNYFNGNTITDYFEVCISTDFTGDPSTATWVNLNDRITTWPSGSDWTFVNSGNIDLTDFIGNKKVYLAFHYKSDSSVASTVEVKNLIVREPEE